MNHCREKCRPEFVKEFTVDRLSWHHLRWLLIIFQLQAEAICSSQMGTGSRERLIQTFENDYTHKPREVTLEPQQVLVYWYVTHVAQEQPQYKVRVSTWPQNVPGSNLIELHGTGQSSYEQLCYHGFVTQHKVLKTLTSLSDTHDLRHCVKVGVWPLLWTNMPQSESAL